MFEKILPKNAVKTINQLASKIDSFYLAGGTGLALQLGHRKSRDFDFFSQRAFNAHFLVNRLSPDKVIQVSGGTAHIVCDKIRFTFMFFEVPLVYEPISWNKIKIADWRDIAAEKFRTIADRGSKRDFYDLYALLQMKSSIKQICALVKKRYAKMDISMYHLLKSLTFFDDAEGDPMPVLLVSGRKWQWRKVKHFFEKNIRCFEKYLLA